MLLSPARWDKLCKSFKNCSCFFQSSQFGKWSNANSILIFSIRPPYYGITCHYRHYPPYHSTWIRFSGASTSHRNKCRSREPLTNFRPPHWGKQPETTRNNPNFTSFFRRGPSQMKSGGVGGETMNWWIDVNLHNTKISTGASMIDLDSRWANQQSWSSWSAKSGVREVQTKWPGNHSKEAILAVWKPHSERWIIGVPEVRLQTKILFAASPHGMKYINTQTHNGYTTLCVSLHIKEPNFTPLDQVVLTWKA